MLNYSLRTVPNESVGQKEDRITSNEIPKISGS
jgi:hypothetical protein